MSAASPTAESSAGPKRKASGRALGLRFASGVVLVPFLLGVAYFGTPGSIGGMVYGLLIAAASGFAAFELRQMLRSGGYRPLTFVLVGVSILLPLDAWLRPAAPPVIAVDGVLIVEVAALLGLVALLVRRSVDRALLDWALSLALALYIGGLMQFYMPLRSVASPVPGFWVIALLVLSWVCDSSAYFVGGAYGRRRLAPLISPAKSVEGAVAGVTFTPLVAALLSLPAQQPPLLLVGYGLIIALATIVGDLAESLIKRQTGVKDSGVLIPGHGGLLDRMDSLLFCAPVAVLYLHAFAA
ncbi:MAG TPA: phosphatidate cytidylyltransferase [Chloroflexota bacterium]|nr:phosphatidate cytidylyltransferase [Chloroflexota bacterium]